MVDELYVKSRESLAVSQWALSSRYFDDCASRAYYSAMQAARSALENFLRVETDGMSHAKVQALFNDAVNRKKLACDPSLHGGLNLLLGLRDIADYGPGRLSGRRAEEAVRRARAFGMLLPNETGA